MNSFERRLQLCSIMKPRNHLKAYILGVKGNDDNQARVIQVGCYDAILPLPLVLVELVRLTGDPSALQSMEYVLDRDHSFRMIEARVR